MTGYWIKLRKSLRTDPRVLALASKLGISKAEVIGALAILWFMADDHGERYAAGVTRVTLSCEIGVTEFAENLPDCWLSEDENGLYLPNYTEHNGTTAKARGLSAERMQRKRYAEGVTKASPEEKRREESSKAVAVAALPKGVKAISQSLSVAAATTASPESTLQTNPEAFKAFERFCEVWQRWPDDGLKKLREKKSAKMFFDVMSAEELATVNGDAERYWATKQPTFKGHYPTNWLSENYGTAIQARTDRAGKD